MKYLENELLIPFNIPDKYGMWYDINSYDWSKLEKPLFGQIGDSEIDGLQLTEATHTIFNIQVKGNGVYGDVRLLENYDNILNHYLDNGFEMVFRSAGSVSYDDTTKYCEFFEIIGFNAILKKNDNFSNMIYRTDKINKIIKNV